MHLLLGPEQERADQFKEGEKQALGCEVFQLGLGIRSWVPDRVGGVVLNQLREGARTNSDYCEPGSFSDQLDLFYFGQEDGSISDLPEGEQGHWAG